MRMIWKNNRKKNDSKFQSILNSEAPFSYVEAYKFLRTNLDFVSSVNGVRSIVITSAVPEESKSTVAVNLAIALAGQGNKVIVVECDLRKPALRKYLKLAGGKKGLSAVLSANETLENCIIDIEEFKISVLLAGAVPPNPSELLNQERMQELFLELKKKYDYVILDAPPIAIVTDAAVIGQMADGAILVVRSKYAATKTIRFAKQKLESVHIKILGVVLTRFEAKKASWRSGYDDTNYGYGEGGK